MNETKTVRYVVHWNDGNNWHYASAMTAAQLTVWLNRPPKWMKGFALIDTVRREKE
jgi:hypothetical protein